MIALLAQIVLRRSFMGRKIESTGNSYLDSPTKSLNLLKSILNSTSTKKDTHFKELIYIVSKQILPLLAEADIIDECEKAQALKKIESKLQSSAAFEMIREKTIIGIGGRFSAGKSCFINSLIGNNVQLLPEGQLPTTSISTYIIKDKTRKNIITNVFGNDIILDDKAVIALNHQYYDKYKIGFAKFIDLFVLATPLFDFEKIALLDTPGYNKYDGGKKADASDNEKARSELKVVDYLIWLIDIENGVIKDEDIDFITNNISHEIPVLFVINKSARKPNDFVMDVIEKTKDILSDTNIQWINVVAYDSRDACEFDDEKYIDDPECDAYIPRQQGKIMRFLQEINDNSLHKPDIITEIITICNDIVSQLHTQLSVCDAIDQQYAQVINDNTDIVNLQSVIKCYQYAKINRRDIERTIMNLRKKLVDIESIKLNKEISND